MLYVDGNGYKTGFSGLFHPIFRVIYLNFFKPAFRTLCSNLYNFATTSIITIIQRRIARHSKKTCYCIPHKSIVLCEGATGAGWIRIEISQRI